MKVIESYIGGDLALPNFAKMDPKHLDNCDQTKDPPESAQKECPKRAGKRVSACLCMEKAEHGSPLTALSSQCSFGNDQCPGQLAEATNILSNHKLMVPDSRATTSPEASKTWDL